MASTYSSIKIQLMATGENSTTWGSVTNVNLGTAIEEAIVGSADVTFASANVTLTLTDTNSSQTARNMRLRCTGTTGGSTRNLVVPSIEKPYIVQNDCADSVQVKTAAGTGITIPAGKTMWVYSDGVNVVDVVTRLSSLTLGTALAVADGGTGSNTPAGARTNLGVPATDGTGASGTWAINVSGSASSASTATSATTAGSVTNSVTFSNTGGAAVGSTFNGSAARTVDYSTVGAPKADGTGASGTWDINISGTAATATSATTADTATTTANLSSGTASNTSFDANNTVTDTGTISAASPGFRGIPQNSQTASYTLTLTDAGKHISITTGGVIVPSNGSVAFPVGTTVVLFNNSSSSQNVTITTDTLRWAGTTSTGTRTLAAYSLATLIKVASTTWVISGAGVA